MTEGIDRKVTYKVFQSLRFKLETDSLHKSYFIDSPDEFDGFPSDSINEVGRYATLEAVAEAIVKEYVYNTKERRIRYTHRFSDEQVLPALEIITFNPESDKENERFPCINFPHGDFNNSSCEMQLSEVEFAELFVHVQIYLKQYSGRTGE